MIRRNPVRPHRARHARRRRLGPVRLGALVVLIGVVVAAVLAVALRDEGPSRPVAPARRAAVDRVSPRVVRGTARIVVGDRRWDLELTSCKATVRRLTVQGDDRDGQTVVASFDRDTKTGSVTLAGPDSAWSVGPAGGTTTAGVELTASHVSGHGTFTRRSFGSPAGGGGDRPASALGSPTPGRFDLTCRR